MSKTQEENRKEEEKKENQFSPQPITKRSKLDWSNKKKDDKENVNGKKMKNVKLMDGKLKSLNLFLLLEYWWVNSFI